MVMPQRLTGFVPLVIAVRLANLIKQRKTKQNILFQTQLENFYDRFLEKVAAGRNKTTDEVHAIAQGRVWTGRQALDIGLVDGLGGFHRALKSAKWMLGLDPSQKVSVVTFGEELSLLERMLLKSLRDNGGFSRVANSLAMSQLDLVSTGLSDLAIPTIFNALREDGTLASIALLDGRPVAMMPFWIRVQ